MRSPRALPGIIDKAQVLADGGESEDSRRRRGRRREQLRLVLADETGIQASFREGRMRDDALQERYVGRYSGDAVPRQ